MPRLLKTTYEYIREAEKTSKSMNTIQNGITSERAMATNEPRNIPISDTVVGQKGTSNEKRKRARNRFKTPKKSEAPQSGENNHTEGKSNTFAKRQLKCHVCGSTEHLARFHKKNNLPTDTKSDKILTTIDSSVNDEEWESEYGLNEQAYIVVKSKRSRLDEKVGEGRLDTSTCNNNRPYNINNTINYVTEAKPCGNNRI